MAWTTTRTLYSVPAQDFTIIVGSGGAPDVAIPSTRGIAYRTDGVAGAVIYHTVDSGTTWSAGPNTMADPGTAAAIPVTASGTLALTIASGAETNTIAAPGFRGQAMSIYADTVGGGTRAITSAVAINQAGNTVMTFAAARDYIQLEAIYTGGALVWQVVSNDGVALS